MSLGVDMPQLTQAEMSNVKTGLADFFRTEINLIIGEFKPRTSDWENPQAFEGAYQEALPLLRFHIVKTLKRDAKKICSFRKVNSRMQKI
jgi:hypothetical protein